MFGARALPAAHLGVLAREMRRLDAMGFDVALAAELIAGSLPPRECQSFPETAEMRVLRRAQYAGLLGIKPQPAVLPRNERIFSPVREAA